MIKPARPAATVCLLRDGSAGLEVLMVQRGRSARFMGGAWVFPGGIVDPGDDSATARERVAGAMATADVPWVAAALRELAEEVRIWITDAPLDRRPPGWPRGDAVYAALGRLGVRFDAGRAAYFANWITPTRIPVRFDTRFYAVAAAGEASADPDPGELAAAEWLRPGDAIAPAAGDERTIPFPTVKTLEHLAAFSTAAAVLDHARSLESIPAILPRARIAADGSLEVVLPGEPGYDEIGDEPGDAAVAASAGVADSGSAP